MTESKYVVRFNTGNYLGCTNGSYFVTEDVYKAYFYGTKEQAKGNYLEAYRLDCLGFITCSEVYSFEVVKVTLTVEDTNYVSKLATPSELPNYGRDGGLIQEKWNLPRPPSKVTLGIPYKPTTTDDQTGFIFDTGE